MNIDGAFVLVGLEDMLLREIASKPFKQKHIASTYALAIISEERDTIDWQKVNASIVERWSLSGLERVKGMAWRKLEEVANAR